MEDMVSGNHDLSSRLEYRLKSNKEGIEGLRNKESIYRKRDARWGLPCYKGVTIDTWRCGGCVCVSLVWEVGVVRGFGEVSYGFFGL